ncbi:hypothetical protein WN944_006524 [Citrus x changshan-huyou]|uniref:Uncharacterized protein n=1 Tax=Citrus x changshan-huyou TaxID=2935761 RepID=A0AAP0QTB6_9ROSI
MAFCIVFTNDAKMLMPKSNRKGKCKDDSTLASTYNQKKDDEFAKLDAALGSLVVGVGHKTSKSVHILQKKTSNCELQDRRQESHADDDSSSGMVVDEVLMSTMVDDYHECSTKSRKKRRFRSIHPIYSLSNPLPVAGSSSKMMTC